MSKDLTGWQRERRASKGEETFTLLNEDGDGEEFQVRPMSLASMLELQEIEDAGRDNLTAQEIHKLGESLFGGQWERVAELVYLDEMDEFFSAVMQHMTGQTPAGDGGGGGEAGEASTPSPAATGAKSKRTSKGSTG